MPAAKAKINEKAEVRKIMEDCLAAICAKDIERLMTHYAPDVIVFDVKPPFQTKGAVAWRHTWEASIPFFPDTFQTETKDVTIHAGEDMAVVHFLYRLRGKDKDHDAMQTWLRCTSAYKKIRGKWKIVHEHGSLPFNPHTGQAVFTLDL